MARAAGTAPGGGWRLWEPCRSDSAAGHEHARPPVAAEAAGASRAAPTSSYSSSAPTRCSKIRNSYIILYSVAMGTSSQDHAPAWHLGTSGNGEPFAVLSVRRRTCPRQPGRYMVRTSPSRQSPCKPSSVFVHVHSGSKDGIVDFSRWPAADRVMCHCQPCLSNHGGPTAFTSRQFEAHGRVAVRPIGETSVARRDVALASFIWHARHAGDARGVLLLAYIKRLSPGLRYPLL